MFEKKWIFLIIATLIINLFVAPFIVFWIGYGTGWVIELLLGDQIVKCFDIFNIHFSANDIPLIVGVIAIIRTIICPPLKYNKNDDM